MPTPELITLAAVLAAFVGLATLRRRRLNFSAVTLLALLAGIPIGLAADSNVGFIEPFGDIYINLLLAAVGPLIVLSILSSITSLGSIKKLRTIGLKSIFWLMLSNALAVVLALGLGLASQIGTGLSLSLGGQELSVLKNSVQDFTDVVVGFFPVNLVGDLGSNRVIPLIVVSVALAVAYLALVDRDAQSVKPFRDLVEALKLIVFKAVGYIIRLTPYAILSLTVEVVGRTENLGQQFWSLAGLLALTWLACAIHAFVVNGVILRTVANISPITFFRKIVPAQVTAFTTQSSIGTLAVTTAVLTRRVGVHPQVAHFTAPLGTTLGMPGCAGIWPILIAVWGINAYDIQYSLLDYAVLALLGTIVSIGTAGVPGTATVAAATVLATAGLPLEFIAVTLPISMIADMARTATNVTAAATSATVVARQTGLLDDDVFADRIAADDAVFPGEVDELADEISRTTEAKS